MQFSLPVEKYARVRNVLLNLEFSDKEIETYLSLLTVKSAAISVLAKQMQQPRSNVQFTIDKLCEKGVVSYKKTGNSTIYVAEDPMRLKSLAASKQKQFEDLQQSIETSMPIFCGLMNPMADNQSVTTLEGDDGMKQIYSEFLPKEFIGYLNPSTMYDAFSQTTLEMLYGLEYQLRGRDLIVQSEHTEQYIKDLPRTETYDYKLLPKDVSFYADVVVYDDVIALFGYGSRKQITRIQNEEFANLIRSNFEMVWQCC